MTKKKVSMSAADKKRFKAILMKLRDTLMRRVKNVASDTLNKSQREASGELSGYTFHMADMASDNYEREFSLELASGERETLMEIDDALRRIQEGTFGVCVECGGSITKKRLIAMPFAKLCLKCQESIEDNA